VSVVDGPCNCSVISLHSLREHLCMRATDHLWMSLGGGASIAPDHATTGL
jgi:hypothetical protein